MTYESTVLGRLPSGTLPSGLVLKESSGGMDSRIHDGVWWTHADSGGTYAYALDHDGTHRKTIQLTGVDMGGGQWEDCAYDVKAGNKMWIANCGGNTPVNSFKAFYFSEPTSLADPGKVLDVPVQTYWFRYPGGKSWNCETMLCDPLTGRVYFVTKDAIGTAQLFQAPATLVARTTGGSQFNDLTAVTSGSWTKGANLTGGDIDSQGKFLYLCNNNTRGFKYDWATKAFVEEFSMPAPRTPSGTTPTAETLFVARGGEFLIRGSEGGQTEIIRLALPPVASVPTMQMRDTPTRVITLRDSGLRVLDLRTSSR